MYINTDFLNKGSVYPFADSDYNKRLEVARTGRLLYDGEFLEVFKDVWASIGTRYGQSWTEIEQVLIKVNLFKALTETFKILAFSKLPVITTSETNQKVLDDLVYGNNFFDVMKRSFISAHAQGTGIFKVFVKDGKPQIRSVNPEVYIPIYAEDDMDSVQAHVLAYEYDVYRDQYNKDKYLKVEINEKGLLTTRLYKIKNGKLDGYKEESINYADDYDWDDFLVFPFDYGHPNWRDYATSQYDDIIPLVDELAVRLSNNSKILDDHADPQLIVPEDALEFDPNSGQHIYKRHQALKIGRDGAKPEYLTWNGNLTDSENQINRIMDLFYLVSGTNPQMFGKDIAGNLSGDALSKILLMPISKTKEMILSLEHAAEKALECALFLQDIKDVVNIEFDIGVFNTLEDLSNRVQAEVRSGIRSIEDAVRKINPRWEEEQIQAEVERIKDEKSAPSFEELIGRE